MEAWRQVLLSELHVELGDGESEEDFYYYHYLLTSSQKLRGITMVVVNLSVFLDIFGYFTIGYLKILCLKLFFIIIGYFTLGYSNLLYPWVIFGYSTLFHFMLF
jgi:hypothetical protein